MTTQNKKEESRRSSSLRSDAVMVAPSERQPASAGIRPRRQEVFAAFGLLGVAGISLIFFAGSANPIGILCGGGVMLLNLWGLRVLVGALMASNSGAQSAPAARQVALVLLLIAKFGLTAFAIFALLSYAPATGVGLLIGISVVVLAMILTSLWGAASALEN